MVDPQPVTTTQELLAQIRDELRARNKQGAQQRPAPADGLRLAEPELDLEPDDLPSFEPGVGRVQGGGGPRCEACDRTFAGGAGLAAHNRAKHGD